MRALLDTHALLWWLAADPALSPTAAKLISDPATVMLVSAASAWEVATKVQFSLPPKSAKGAKSNHC